MEHLFPGECIPWGRGEHIWILSAIRLPCPADGRPKAKAVLQRRFGPYLKHPMAKAAGSLTLAQLMEMGAVYLPQKTIQETVRELSAL